MGSILTVYLAGSVPGQVRRELDRDGEPVDMLSLAGLGAELWQNVDVDVYLEQGRASWDD